MRMSAVGYSLNADFQQKYKPNFEVCFTIWRDREPEHYLAFQVSMLIGTAMRFRIVL
jgi:hypothetical protein